VVTWLSITPGKDVILDLTHPLTLAAHHLATTFFLENVADPDKSNASPREDVTLSVPADLPFLKESTRFAVKEEFATAKEHVLSSPLEFKLAFVIQ